MPVIRELVVRILLLISIALFAFQVVASNKVSEQNHVVLVTNKGNIVISLNEQAAPKTVENFKSYVASGFYNDTIFHRVIAGFMIQGGGFDQQLKRKSAQSAIRNEADNGLENVVGTIAMARTADPHSATSQFFINVADNRSLNHVTKQGNGWGYAVFGKVTEGLDIVLAISNQITTSKQGYRDVPVDPVIIEKAYLK